MTALQIYRGPPRLSKDIEADKQCVFTFSTELIPSNAAQHRRAITARAEADERLRRANDERARLDHLLASYTQQKKQAEAGYSMLAKSAIPNVYSPAGGSK